MRGMIISYVLVYVAKPFSLIYAVFSFVWVLLLIKVGTLFEEQNA